MTTYKKRIPVWLLVLAAIGSCAFTVFIFGRYSIVHEREPAWSPDGKYIAFACEPYNKLDQPPVGFSDIMYYEDVNGICMKDLVSGKITWITRSLEMRAPSWSHDGESLAWIDDSYPYKIRVWNMITRKYSQYPLDERCSYSCFPAWSLDGSRIFLQGTSTLLDLTSGRFIDFGTGHISTFSPDGNYIAYDAGQVNATDEFSRDHLVVLDTRTKRIVFESKIASADLDGFNWSPDGSVLTWVAVPERGNVQLGLTKISTGETSFLYINDIGSPKRNVWSPNSDKIILQTVGKEWNNLVIIQVDCKSSPFKCELVNQKAYDIRGIDSRWYAWSPDGRQIAYETTNQFGYVWIIDLETGQDYPLIERNE